MHKRRWSSKRSESEELERLRAERSNFQNEMVSLQNVTWNNTVPSSSPKKRKTAVPFQARAPGGVEKYEDK